MSKPSVHFWDMDHTLIDNDCDVSWKHFLIEKELAPADAVQQIDLFWEQYKRGELDFEAFIAFQLAEFKGRTPEEMEPLVQEHFEQVVLPRLYSRARDMVRAQIDAGERVILLTATNNVIAAPLAESLHIPVLIATRCELVNGLYSGNIVGDYCGGEGKLVHLRAHCEEQGISLSDVAYYGDSKADIPVLLAVGFPVACNPMPSLYAAAEENGWPVIDFSDPGETAAH